MSFQFYEEVKPIIDIISLSTVVATLVGLLPHLAAILSIVWAAIRIYETNTVQRLLYGKNYRRRRDDYE